MDSSLVFNALKKYLDLKTDKELASYLGIKVNVLSNWKSRNTMDINTVYSKCEFLNPHWLLTGEGSMLRVDGSDSAIRNRIGELKRLFRMPDDEFTAKTGLNIDFFYDFNNKYVVNKDVLAKIKSIFKDVNETWLLTGEGLMIKEVLPDEERMRYEKRIKELESIIEDKNTIIEMLNEKLGRNKKINKAG